MSATGRGAERTATDFYPTPRWCIRRLIESVHLPTGNWIEPAYGHGVICRTVNEHYESEGREPVTWTTVDIRSDTEADIITDYCFFGCPELESRRKALPIRAGRRSWLVLMTNPPYNLALDFLKQALIDAWIVALLLRLNFLASGGNVGRPDFLRQHTPAVYVLPERPSFDGEGTDATEYAWMVWGLGHHEIKILPSTSKRERMADQDECRRIVRDAEPPGSNDAR